MCEMAGRGKPGDARNGAEMARTDGIGRGVLHGSLIGVAVLAGLSLAFPLRDTAPVEGDKAPAASVDPQPVEASEPVQEAQAVQAEEPAAENAATPLSEMQMGPPSGSEFARTEDRQPSLPATSSAPSMAGQVAEVELPSAESLPLPTGPGTRPDTQDQTEAPQVGDESQLQVVAPAAEAAQPESQPNPVRLAEPAQDAGLAQASRAAPSAPEETEEIALPGAEAVPDTRLAARPEAPTAPRSSEPATEAVSAGDLPSAQTGTEATSSPIEEDAAMESANPVEADQQTARPSAPVLEAPDSARETVPPPPAAADMPPVEEPVAEIAEPAARVDTGETLPEVSPSELAEAVPEPVMLPAIAPEPAPEPEPEPVVEQVAQAAAEPATSAPVPGSEPAAPAVPTMGYPAPDLDIPSLSLTGLP